MTRTSIAIAAACLTACSCAPRATEDAAVSDDAAVPDDAGARMDAGLRDASAPRPDAGPLDEDAGPVRDRDAGPPYDRCDDQSVCTTEDPSGAGCGRRFVADATCASGLGACALRSCIPDFRACGSHCTVTDPTLLGGAPFVHPEGALIDSIYPFPMGGSRVAFRVAAAGLGYELLVYEVHVGAHTLVARRSGSAGPVAADADTLVFAAPAENGLSILRFDGEAWNSELALPSSTFRGVIPDPPIAAVAGSYLVTEAYIGAERLVLAFRRNDDATWEQVDAIRVGSVGTLQIFEGELYMGGSGRLSIHEVAAEGRWPLVEAIADIEHFGAVLADGTLVDHTVLSRPQQLSFGRRTGSGWAVEHVFEVSDATTSLETFTLRHTHGIRLLLTESSGRSAVLERTPDRAFRTVIETRHPFVTVLIDDGLLALWSEDGVWHLRVITPSEWRG